MVIGDVIGKHTAAVYTAPSRRISGSATFGVNVLQVGGTTSGTLNIDIEHRNNIDDTWTTAASFSAITSTGVYTQVATTLKELVRLKFSQTTGSADAFMRVAILAPVWS